MFFYYYDNGWNITDYDIDKNGIKQYKNKVFLYHCSIVVNADQLVNTLREAVNGCNGNGRFSSPVIYKGVNVNTMIRDLFISYNSNTGQYYSDSHFDDTILKQFEAVV